MNRLSMLAFCALCGCGAGQEPSPRGHAAIPSQKRSFRSCHLVKDDGGAVGVFVSVVVRRLTAQRVDSIAFHEDGSDLLTWTKGVPLKTLADIDIGGDKVRLSYAANENAVSWETVGSPTSATVTIDGVPLDDADDDDGHCALAELGGYPSGDLAAPTSLSTELLDPGASVTYGNCPHCVQSFLCGCLDELYGVDSSGTISYCKKDVESLANCADVRDLLFDIR